eukprot:587935-Rhodomonas_salina.2
MQEATIAVQFAPEAFPFAFDFAACASADQKEKKTVLTCATARGLYQDVVTRLNPHTKFRGQSNDSEDVDEGSPHLRGQLRYQPTRVLRYQPTRVLRHVHAARCYRPRRLLCANLGTGEEYGTVSRASAAGTAYAEYGDRLWWYCMKCRGYATGTEHSIWKY